MLELGPTAAQTAQSPQSPQTPANFSGSNRTIRAPATVQFQSPASSPATVGSLAMPLPESRRTDLFPMPTGFCFTRDIPNPEFSAGDVDRIFRENVFGFLFTDVERVIDRAARGDPSENLLAAIGVIAATEAIGFVACRARPYEKTAGEGKAAFEYVFRRMGPEYVRLIDVEGFDPYVRLRHPLLHELGVRAGFTIDLPGRLAPCGLHREADGMHFAIGRYTADLREASRAIYREISGA